MGRHRKGSINTKSYIPLTSDGSAPICLEHLEPIQKDYLGALLQIRFLNEAYSGNFSFWIEELPAIETLFPEILPCSKRTYSSRHLTTTQEPRR